MIADFPLELILMPVAAFLLGWVLSTISASISRRLGAKKRDPRDDRIRALEAELRVASSNAEKSQGQLEQLKKEFDELEKTVVARDDVISDQQLRLQQTTTDLRDSVAKTRELREELTNRATENVKSMAKLREVETELSVAHASTDLLATGVLDYEVVSEPDGPHEATIATDGDKAAG